MAEDTVNPTGQTVSAIFSGQFADVDAGSSFAGIAVVSSTADVGTEGTWQYSSNGGGNWFAIGAVSDGPTALAVSSSSLIRFVPVANYNGTPPALVVRGLDNTHAGGFSSTVGSETRVTVDTTTNGGTTAIAAATASLSTSITAVNDPPLLTGSGGTLAYTENAAAVAIDPGLALSDVDSGTLSTAWVWFGANYASGQDVLGFTDQNGITSSWDAGAGILTLSGTATVAQYQTALRSVTYVNGSDAPSTVTRMLSFAANDGIDGSNIVSRNLTVTAVNDAPTLGDGTLAAVNEDTVNPAGQAVSTVFTGQFSDVDAGSSFAGIAVVGNAADAGTQGTWQYSTDAGISWFDVGAVGDDATALALSTSTLLRFVPVLDYSGTPPALSVRGLDDTYVGGFTSGATRQNVDTTTNGGVTPVASGTANVQTSITAVNDAPVRTSGSVNNLAVAEDSGLTSLGLGTIAYGPGGGADESSQTLTYEITVIPDVNFFGRIYLADGVTQVGTGFYSLAQLQGMQFAPVANFSGGPSFFSYQVHDTGGTTNGGNDTLTETIQITVTPVNDAPVVDLDGVTALTLLGSETQVNTFASGDQTFAGNAKTVAIDDAGNYVVVWTSYNQDATNTWGVYAQRFNASGVTQGSEFRVNSTMVGDQAEPAVAVAPNGDFVIVWSGNGPTDSTGIYGQRYNAAGLAQGAEFRINTTDSAGAEFIPSVAMDDAGNFVVVWQDSFWDDIYGQRYNAAGVAQGSEFLISNGGGSAFDPQVQVAMTGSGAYVVTWSDGSGSVYARRYDASGTAQGAAFQVNLSTAQDRTNPSLAVRDDGSFVIAWTSLLQDAGGNFGVYARRFNAAGAALSADILVNTTQSGDQSQPSIALTPDGGFVVTWTDRRWTAAAAGSSLSVSVCPA